MRGHGQGRREILKQSLDEENAWRHNMVGVVSHQDGVRVTRHVQTHEASPSPSRECSIVPVHGILTPLNAMECGCVPVGGAAGRRSGRVSGVNNQHQSLEGCRRRRREGSRRGAMIHRHRTARVRRGVHPILVYTIEP